MKFIREMIARKAAGDDRADYDIDRSAGAKPDAGLDLGQASAEIDDDMTPKPVFEDTGAASANAGDAPFTDYDEEAELEALDAALPPFEENGKVERLFPDEAADADAPDDALFADIPDPDTDEPVPELTASDIERAMQNRKRFWQNLPDETDNPLAIPDDGEEAVTRKIRPSTVYEEAPADMMMDDDAPEMAADVIADHEEPEAAGWEAEPAPEPEVEVETALDEMGVEAAVQDEAEDHTAEVIAAAPAEDPAQDPAEEPVVDDIRDEAPVWPAPQEPAFMAPPVAEDPAPAAESFDGPDIQALMAKAALEAAGTTIEAAAAEKPARRAGRVKTRLLGFQPELAQKDVFDRAGKATAGEPDMFPVGWMVVIKGPGRGASFTLHNGVSLIGRGEDQAVTLDFGDNSISRDNHASVAYDDESHQFFLGHGGKSNIVRLNRKPVLSTEELSTGDEIRLGETTLKFAAFCSAGFNWADEGAGGMDDAATR